MAASVKKVFRAANRVNDILLPQFENLKQRKLGKSAFNIYVDYKAVFVDFFKAVKGKPLRATSKFAVLGGLYIVYRYNPDERTYHDLLMTNSLELLQLSNRIRNPESDSYTQNILQLYYEGRIKRQSFGLFSVMMVDEFHNDSDIYEKHCYYTKQRWLYLWKQVIDVGLLGHWVYLENSMADFDINSRELAGLPEDEEEGNAFLNKVKKISFGLAGYMEDCFYTIKKNISNFYSSDSS